jgi:excisionase family DNA binding protein
MVQKANRRIGEVEYGPIAIEGAVAPVKKPRGGMTRRGQLPGPEQRLVGVDAAAAMLGVSTNFAYAMIRDGDLPVVDLGKRTLVAVADIDTLITRKRRPAPAKAA